MSLCESDLFLDRARIPAIAAVIANIASYGHVIAFPAGFSLSDPTHGFWVPITLDGEQTGFDYKLFARADYPVDDPDAPEVPEFGDGVLSFAGRGDSRSILAMALVQRAICELSDAHGWWQEGEEAFSNADMIEFCTATADAAKAAPAPAASVSGPSLLNPRFEDNYLRTVGMSLVWGAALAAGAALLIFLMGYFLAPEAGH